MRTFIKPLFFLWPGSTGAVIYGLWGQLGIALLFGGVLQALIFVNYYWLDFVPKIVRTTSWVSVVVIHLLLSAVASSRLKQYERMKNYDAQGRVFLEAQTHYLRGNWFETECCLKSVLKKNPLDVEALLMLATLFRHTQRFQEARKTLRELEKIEDSIIWREEILIEKGAVAEDEKDAIQEKFKQTETSASNDEIASCQSEEENAKDDVLDVAGDRPILKRCVGGTSCEGKEGEDEEERKVA